MEVVTTSQPSERAWGDLTLAWRVVKHVASNAIVIANDLATIGVGSGQMSRVDAVRIAVEKARANGHDLQGAVLASDAEIAMGLAGTIMRRSSHSTPGSARSSSRAARNATER